MIDTIFQIYSEFKQLFEPTVVLLVGIFTVLVTKNSNKYSVARERVECVYHPLFLAIEPYLYKDVKMSDVENFLQTFHDIDQKYSFLVYPSLRQHIGFFIKNREDNLSTPTTKEEWFLICDYVCNDYDRLCKTAHLPIRSTAYRLNYHQYKSKQSMFWGTIRLMLPSILIAGMLLLIINPVLLLLALLIFLAFYILKIMQ
jgi:hypothetical protein